MWCEWCHVEDSLQTVTFCDKCWEDYEVIYLDK